MAQERCISVGARDRTARLWKVVEETQLVRNYITPRQIPSRLFFSLNPNNEQVFRGGGGEKKSRSSAPRVLEGSMDRVAMIDEEHFITGGDNGSLSLWTMHKKKPVFTVSSAHGLDPALQPAEASAETNPTPDTVPQPQPRWITALATIPYSDVILSGSWDGQVRAWKVTDDKKKIEAVGAIGSGELGEDGGAVAKGVINDISVFERGDRAKNGISVVLAMGKEHRMGRWKKVQGRNGLLVLEVPRSLKTNGVHEEAGEKEAED